VPSVKIFDMAISDSEIHSVIFDLTKSIAGHSDLETLCDALAAPLKRVVNFDDLGVALHDPIRDEFGCMPLARTGRVPYRLTEARCKAGVDNYLSILVVQRWLYSGQQSLVGLLLSRVSNLVTLYKALGGGA